MHKYMMAEDLNSDNNNNNNNNNNNKWVFSVGFMWYLSIFLINKLRRLKIYLLKGEKSLSAEMELLRIPSRCSSEE